MAGPETDPRRVCELGKAKAEENRGFRELLRRSQIPEAELDATVARLHREVATQVDCRECGVCCRDLAPTLGARDAARLAKAVGLTPGGFRRKFLAPDRDRGRLVFRQKPCPVLSGNLCVHYEVRPRACRSFPELDRPGFLARSVLLLYNLPYCPIIYNVFELLKKETAGRLTPAEPRPRQG
jgi:Fe-S-cluster containining protein